MKNYHANHIFISRTVRKGFRVFAGILIVALCATQVGLAYADDATSAEVASSSSVASDSSDFTASSSLPAADAHVTAAEPVDDSAGNLEDGAGDGASTTVPIDVASSSLEFASTTPVASTTLIEGATTIVTGDAIASADVVNVVNANITNSEGLISFLNLFEPYLGTIDLSQLNFSPDGCGSCTVQTLQSSSSVETVNSSTIVNNLEVSAVTGENQIDGQGTSTIVTGDAMAAGNVVNVVNTNITDSNYLLLVLNDFSTLSGDVVLPGKDFFTQFLNTSGDAAGTANISNSNSSIVTNNSSVSAISGNNVISGAGGTVNTDTGSASAISNTLTVSNTNIDTGGQVLLLVHVLGSWNGKVFSLPPGLSWQETPDGLVLYGSGVGSILDDGTGSGTSGGSIANTNTADIQNAIKVFALTGKNKIASEGSASISTGNAMAAGNVMNLVNTNVVGKNILFGLINIMGDWQGNLAFGQPDLWVGAQAKVSGGPLYPGSDIEYTVTVMNRGTTDATNVALKAQDLGKNIAMIDDPGIGTIQPDGSVVWEIPLLAKGDSMEFRYHERVNQNLQFVGEGQLTEQVSATEYEDDAVPSDNTDSIAFEVIGPAVNRPVSRLSIEEDNSASSTIIAPGRYVTYYVKVNNPSWAGPAQNVALHEELYDPYGNVVSTTTLPIGLIEPGDRFLVSYDTWFPEDAESGWYISSSSLSGVDSSGAIWRTKDIISSSGVDVESPHDSPSGSGVPNVVYVPAPSSTEERVNAGNSGNAAAVVDMKVITSGANLKIEHVATSTAASSSASAETSITVIASSDSPPSSSSEQLLASLSAIIPNWFARIVKGWWSW